MSITEADVRHIAALARVGLDVDRIPSLVTELNGILGHMDVLHQVDVSTIDTPSSPASPAVAMPLRPDTVHSSTVSRDMSATAPAMRDGFFLVPRLTTHGELGGADDTDDVGHA